MFQNLEPDHPLLLVRDFLIALPIGLAIAFAPFLVVAQELVPAPADQQVVVDYVNGIRNGYVSLGVLGALSAALAGVIRIYRLDVIQRLLAKHVPQMQWARWDLGVKLTVVLLVSLAGAIVSMLIAGAPITGATLIAAVVNAAGAVVIDQVTSATGAALDPVVPDSPAIRKPLGLVIPFPKKIGEAAPAAGAQ